MTSSSIEPDQTKYWPFEISPRENLSEEQSLQISFMKQAFQEGYSPHVSFHSTYQISKGNKGARIIYRGSRMWEVLLGNSERVSIQAYVTKFAESATAALAWMRNEDANSIASKLRPHLAKMPKGMESLIINDDIAST
jgi:hypothetical protein